MSLQRISRAARNFSLLFLLGLSSCDSSPPVAQASFHAIHGAYASSLHRTPDVCAGIEFYAVTAADERIVYDSIDQLSDHTFRPHTSLADRSQIALSHIPKGTVRLGVSYVSCELGSIVEQEEFLTNLPDPRNVPYYQR